jgi:hypothetical protein
MAIHGIHASTPFKGLRMVVTQWVSLVMTAYTRSGDAFGLPWMPKSGTL